MPEKNTNQDTYHHGNLRSALIDAALEAISEKGVKAMTIREVARRAGVSHTAPYRHFQNKDELLAAVAAQGFDMLEKETRKRFLNFPDDPLACFQEAGITCIDFAISNPSHYRVMFGSGESKNYSDYKESSRSSFNILLECIVKCQEEKRIRKGDPVMMSLAAWSIVHGFAMLFIDGHIASSELFDKKTETLKKIVTHTLYTGLK